MRTSKAVSIGFEARDYVEAIVNISKFDEDEREMLIDLALIGLKQVVDAGNAPCIFFDSDLKYPVA